MNRFWSYLKVQLKKNGKIFPTIMFMTFLLLAGIGLLGYLVFQSNVKDGELSKRFQIGIVGDTSDPYLSMGITAAQNLDSSRFMLDFIFIEEEQALELLNKGEVSAYLVIPDGFIDSVMVGENKRIQFISSEGTVDISTILLNEVADVISKMITESQAAGSGLYKIMKQNEIQSEYGYYSERLDIYIAKLVLSRTDIYEVETYRGVEQLSIMSYYVCGILLFFLLIWGMNAASILAEKNQAMQKLLKSRGQRITSQVIAEYLAYFILMFISMAVIITIAYAAMKKTGAQLPEWEYANQEIIFKFFRRMIPVMMLVASIQFTLYECTKECISGVLFQFIAAISMGYISGCFYPISFFPEMIQKMNHILPTGIAMEYLCNAMLGEAIFVDGLKLVGYTIIFVMISAFIRNTRLQNVDKGYQS